MTPSGGRLALNPPFCNGRSLVNPFLSFDPVAGSGMRKSEFCGVEKLPAEHGKLGLADKQLSRSSIESVSDERMLCCGEVHSDLMRPSRDELAVHK